MSIFDFHPIETKNKIRKYFQLDRERNNLQFQDHGYRRAIVIRIVQLNDSRMMQAAHNFNFTFHVPSILFACYFYVFGGELKSSRFISANIHGSIGPSVSESYII